MSTSNKDFKIKNGLIVQGTTATVNGENILTSASNIDDLANINTFGVQPGNTLVYEPVTQQWIPGQASGGGASVEASETPPANPNSGDLWLDSSDGSLYIYYVDTDGGQWIAVKTAIAGGGGASIEISDVPPQSPEVGNLWFDSTNGAMYVYYDDGDASQWVAVKASTTTPHPSSRIFQSDTAPLAADVTENDFWFNTNTGNLYIWYISNGIGQWISVQTDVTVAISSGIDELSDVEITTPSNNEALVYDSISQRWENKNFVDAGFYTSPNYIINGAFDIWQRGTSFTPATSILYNADRFFSLRDGSGATVTVSRQAFTPGTAPVAGYESAFFYRYNQSVAGTGGTYSNILQQRIEDVRTLAGQTASVSFWAKADTTRTIRAVLGQQFGTGGTPSAANNKDVADFTVTTSWQRFSGTITLDSLTGKTLGTNADHSLQLIIQSLSLNATQTIDIWGVQVESGPFTTPFRRNANSPQGELAACQRYCLGLSVSASGERFGIGMMGNSGTGNIYIYPPVTMRSKPSAFTFSALADFNLRNGDATITVTPTDIVLSSSSTPNLLQINVSGTVTTNQPAYLRANNANALLVFSAEL